MIARVYPVAMVPVGALAPMDVWLRIVMIIGGIVPFAVGVTYALRSEQVVGY